MLRTFAIGAGLLTVGAISSKTCGGLPGPVSACNTMFPTIYCIALKVMGEDAKLVW